MAGQAAALDAAGQQMSLFKSQTHQDIWIEHNCERCAHHPGCPIIAKAIRTKRKPPQWDRNPRKNALMHETIRCKDKVRVLPIPKVPKMFDDVPMFDVAAPVDMDPDHA